MDTAIGHQLRLLRESKGLSLEQAARETRLRPGFLRELEECGAAAELPDIYHRLSLRMYARHLGFRVESVRPGTDRRSVRRPAPIGAFVRRMGRAPKPPRLNAAQRSRLIGIAKTTSAAIVIVLGVGLWSLNAKLARLNFDETKPRIRAAAPAPAAPLPVMIETPRCTLEEPVHLALVPGA